MVGQATIATKCYLLCLSSCVCKCLALKLISASTSVALIYQIVCKVFLSMLSVCSAPTCVSVCACNPCMHGCICELFHLIQDGVVLGADTRATEVRSKVMSLQLM